ncbi:nose resistant to fluoxetine protein 6 isoform X1 [Ixodes scapularis]|uniref:nose resistant to fluoxetine protein 6 isoform X1 n=3 Tax=Ixodes scapularis TaxID=6945 RepID=UPI001C37FD4B|nr:nose resistant to fluoxetine protein 6 isoform X1 [Ixodes scapularis]
MPWALRMVDATGRPSAGLLFGTTGSYGDYDECLSVRHGSATGGFAGKYCTLFYSLPAEYVRKTTLSMQKQGYYQGRRAPDYFKPDVESYYKGLRLGLCVPSVCSVKDVERLIGLVLGGFGFKYHVAGCDYEDNPDRNWNPIRIAMISIIGVLGLLLLLGTVLDLVLRPGSSLRSEESPWKYLLAFSAVENTRKLLNTRFDEGSDNRRLACFAGLKVFSTTWVILGHSYFIVDISALRSYFKVLEATEEVFFTLIVNAYPSIATFFFLGGFLLSYNVLKRMKNLRGHYAVVFGIMLVRRYVRLTVPVMFMVGVSVLQTKWIRGPAYFELLGHNEQRCRETWWTVPLHVNNWQPFLKMCLPFYWYISVDWQLYLVFCAVPLIMLRREKLGLFLMGTATTAASVYVVILTYMRDYQPLPLLMDTNQQRPSDTVDYVYVRPFTHVGSYCSGLLFGYFVVKFPDIKIHKVTQVALWLVASAVALCVVMVPHEWLKGNFPSRIEAGIYAGLHRSVWAVCLGWLVYACVTGRAGLLNRFLSWNFFVPLSRLSLGAYLTSIFILTIRGTYRREIGEYYHFPMVMLFLSTTFLSYLTAYVLFLLVECPVGNIEKRLFMPKGVMAAAEQTANGHSRAGHEKRSNGHSNGAFSDIVEKIDVEDSHDKPVVVARF